MSEEIAEKAPGGLVKLVKRHLNRVLVKGREKRDQVRLQTITRDYIDVKRPDGTIEKVLTYTMRTYVMDRKELPGKAVHVSGKKGYYALVDMDPQYPPYIYVENLDETLAIHTLDSPYPPHNEGEGNVNTFDAQGYYWYYLDERMSKGFDAVGKLAIDKPLDLKMMAMIGVGALVAFWILSRMM